MALDQFLPLAQPSNQFRFGTNTGSKSVERRHRRCHVWSWMNTGSRLPRHRPAIIT